jgi:hypothetical protein
MAYQTESADGRGFAVNLLMETAIYPYQLIRLHRVTLCREY